MVTTDTTSQVNECTAWRERLHAHRDELNQLSHELETVSKGKDSKDILTEVEHFQNQFYIQQMNFHDLNHAIKSHAQKLTAEGNQHPPETINEHETLLGQFNHLEYTLEKLKEEFNGFKSKV
ncbi:MAG: hypothetical protein WAT19_04790 [Ferruginibacter sp.]